MTFHQRSLFLSKISDHFSTFLLYIEKKKYNFYKINYICLAAKKFLKIIKSILVWNIWNLHI